LAASGMRGAPDILENPQGFVSVFARTPLMGAYQGFGRIWLTDTLCYKIYPGCAYIDSFVDCILMMVRQNAIDARKVKAIHIAATPLTLAMDALSAPHLKGPNTLAQTLNFSVGYNAAVALIDKDLGPRQLTRERIKDPAVWELAAKVHLTQDDVMTQRMRDRSLLKVTTTPEGERYELDLSTADLTNFRMSLGARVCIEMEDGRSFDAEQEVPFGAAGRTYDERRKAVEDKFRRETRYTLRKEKMEKAIDVIHHLEDTSSSGVRELVRLCCSEKI
jgi:2-methylcitrate dehydratase PrpD